MHKAVPTRYFCKVLDHLPELPGDLLEDSSIFGAERIWPGQSYFTKNKTNQQAPDIKTKSAIRSRLSDWVHSNISVDPTSIIVRSVEVNELKNFYPPHVDTNREFTLIYNLVDSGGSIVFWKFMNFPAFTDQLPRIVYNNYQALTEVYRMPTPVGKWYLINNTCIHSVEGMTGIRIGLQVSVSKDDPLVDHLERL